MACSQVNNSVRRKRRSALAPSGVRRARIGIELLFIRPPARLRIRCSFVRAKVADAQQGCVCDHGLLTNEHFRPSQALRARSLRREDGTDWRRNTAHSSSGMASNSLLFCLGKGR